MTKKPLNILETKKKIVKLYLQASSFSFSFLIYSPSTELHRYMSLEVEKSGILSRLAVVTEPCTPYFDMF
jgi:hypothetical protein